MKNLLISVWVFACLLLSVETLTAQTVSNVNAEQVGNTIHITYDLDKATDISVFVSTDGGNTYWMLNRVSGDVGKIVGPGHKTIVWDVLEEQERLVGDNFVFKVKAQGEYNLTNMNVNSGNANKSPQLTGLALKQYNNAKTLNTAGTVLWATGAATLVTGLIVGCVDDFNYAGVGLVILMPIGGGLLIPGAVMSGVGIARMKSIRNSQARSLYDFNIGENLKHPVNPELYTQRYNNAKALNTAGTVLWATGAATFVTGLFLGVFAVPYVGLLMLMPIGSGLLIPGAIMSGVATARMKSIRNSQAVSLYDFNVGKKLKHPVTLTLHTNGISLKF